MSSHVSHPLKKWRVSQGLTVAELAAKVPVARQTWHAWERGTSRPPARLMPTVVALTGNKVQPNDFYILPSLPQAEAA